MQISEVKGIDRVEVRKNNELAGHLLRTPDGCRFEYSDTFIAAHTEGIAYSMPPRKIPYETRGINLHPFFAGLLPEGIRLSTLTTKVKTSSDDLLSLLLAVGADCIGDVTINLPDSNTANAHAAINETKLTEINFYDLFRKSIGLESYDDLKHETAIAGVQEKISVRRLNLPIKFTHGKHKSFILKLNPPSKALLVENEAFFLAMARDCGLEVNNASLVFDLNKNPGLLVERFDRLYDPHTKTTLQVHQEDACQFLEKYPADKYHVSYAEIAKGIEELSSAPILEIANLLKLLAFSYIIGNGDLHAKNISLRTNPHSGRIELSPAYDILSTLPYGDRKMALKLDGKDDSLTRQFFVSFGKRFAIRQAAITEILSTICESASEWIPRIPEIGFSDKKSADIQRCVRLRINEVLGP